MTNVKRNAHHQNGELAVPMTVPTVRTRANAVPLTEPVAVLPATKDEPVTKSACPEPGVVAVARTVPVHRPTSSVIHSLANVVVLLDGREISATRNVRMATMDRTAF